MASFELRTTMSHTSNIPTLYTFKVAGDEKLDTSILNFGINLFQALADNYTGNVVVSPIAVQTLLTVMYTGSEGNTSPIMLQGLNISGTPSTDQVAKQFSQLVTPILISPVIQMSTGIYCSTQYQIQAVWAYEAQYEFLTDLQSVNFNNSQASADQMNAYINRITFGEITGLVQPKWLNSNTSVVLVTALYLNGPWKNRFDKHLVPNVTFFNGLKDCQPAIQKVDMMHVKVTVPIRCSKFYGKR